MTGRSPEGHATADQDSVKVSDTVRFPNWGHLTERRAVRVRSALVNSAVTVPCCWLLMRILFSASAVVGMHRCSPKSVTSLTWAQCWAVAACAEFQPIVSARVMTMYPLKTAPVVQTMSREFAEGFKSPNTSDVDDSAVRGTDPLPARHGRP